MLLLIRLTTLFQFLSLYYIIVVDGQIHNHHHHRQKLQKSLSNQKKINQMLPVQVGQQYKIRISSNEINSDILPIISTSSTTITDNNNDSSSSRSSSKTHISSKSSLVRKRISSYILHHDNASYLSIHFAYLNLPSHCLLDLLDGSSSSTTSSRSIQQAIRFDGRGGGGRSSSKRSNFLRDVGNSSSGDTFWAQHIVGDTIHIVLECTITTTNNHSNKNNSNNYTEGNLNYDKYQYYQNDRHIFEIDKYVSGFAIDTKSDRNKNRFLKKTKIKKSSISTNKSDSSRSSSSTSTSENFSYNNNNDNNDNNSASDNNNNNTSLRGSYQEPYLETLCGEDNKRNAICYKKTNPMEYDNAKAVARLLINGTWACTGWLVGNTNKLITNYHCIESIYDAINTDYEFMGEESTCESNSGNCWTCNRGDIYTASDVLYIDAEKDLTLIQLEGNPVQLYGYLDLDNRNVEIGEDLYIPQHPYGRAKEFNLDGSCKVLPSSGVACSSTTAYNDIQYRCDTEAGSSGSPVISRSSYKVIALHHCGASCKIYGNLGVPVTAFYDDIASFIYPNDDNNDVQNSSSALSGNNTYPSSEDPSTTTVVLPTMTPSLSKYPTVTPSLSLVPSIGPSISEEPSVVPSISLNPSLIPSMSNEPSIKPSMSVQPSMIPTMSNEPSVTPSLSSSPSTLPSLSLEPSQTPTKSLQPSYMPTLSPEPVNRINSQAPPPLSVPISNHDPSNDLPFSINVSPIPPLPSQATVISLPQLRSYGGKPPKSKLPLGRCEGDCDKGKDCKSGLQCFQRGPFDAVPGCKGGHLDGSKTDYCTILP